MDQKLTGRKRVLYLLFVAVFLFVMVSPMLYMISASFMPESDLNHIPPRILPSAGAIKNYVAGVFEQAPAAASAVRVQQLCDHDYRGCDLYYGGLYGLLCADQDQYPV